MSEVIAHQELEQESPAQNTKRGDVVTPEKMTYDDSSGAIFSMYITQAQKLDEENVENWTGVADRILIFVRFQTALFLAISVVILLTDRPFLIYGGYFHFHQLPELATRSPHNHSVPPCTDIPTTFQHD